MLAMCRVLISFASSLHSELRLLMCAGPNPTLLKKTDLN